MRDRTRYRQYLSPIAVMGRLMVCSKCSCLVDVIEIPTRTIDPDRYSCPDHWQPIQAARQTLDQPRPPFQWPGRSAA